MIRPINPTNNRLNQYTYGYLVDQRDIKREQLLEIQARIDRQQALLAKHRKDLRTMQKHLSLYDAEIAKRPKHELLSYDAKKRAAREFIEFDL